MSRHMQLLRRQGRWWVGGTLLAALVMTLLLGQGRVAIAPGALRVRPAAEGIPLVRPAVSPSPSASPATSTSPRPPLSPSPSRHVAAPTPASHSRQSAPAVSVVSRLPIPRTPGPVAAARPAVARVRVTPSDLPSQFAARTSTGTSTIGALFTGALNQPHVCTAAVLDSPGGD